MSTENQGNPSVDGSEEFFDAMERQVNSAVINDSQPEQATPVAQSGPEEVTHETSEQGSVNHEVDWEKRYKDSSREAIKMREQLGMMKPFVPLLNAMKNDSGLVNHIKGYLENGGKPAASVKEQLNLDEDFIYDPNEAMTDPDSDSAKVFNAHVDSMVQGRVNNIMQGEKKKAAQVRQAIDRRKEEAAFKQKYNMGDEDFAELMNQARSHKLSIEDIYHILNKDRVAGNVARSTKQDMLNQMKNVRDIPTTASGVNSPSTERDPNSDVFDTILGSDGGVDDLFG